MKKELAKSTKGLAVEVDPLPEKTEKAENPEPLNYGRASIAFVLEKEEREDGSVC